MKAIIEIAKHGSAIQAARQQIAAAKLGSAINFHLYFESAQSLFTELTSTRLDLLYSLKNIAPCSVHALAQTIARNYTEVYNDVIRLERLSLIERTDDEMIIVPFDAIEILMPLAKVA